MTIAPGYYRTRGGHKARVLCTDAEGPYPIVGYICYKCGPAPCLWDWDSVAGSVPGPLDLIHPWVDAPVVDWSREPKWVRSICMDLRGKWNRCSGIPCYMSGVWCDGGFYQELHHTEYPQFAGVSEHSIAIRPS